MKTAEEFVKEYYQLPKSKVRSVSITSLIKCLKCYEEQLNKPCVINSDQLHICKYCGAETTQPDEQCYKAENKAEVCEHIEDRSYPYENGFFCVKCLQYVQS